MNFFFNEMIFQAEWNHLDNERKKLTEQQNQLSMKHQQINDELRRIQQDVQSKLTNCS